jgi:hypothetical protein
VVQCYKHFMHTCSVHAAAVVCDSMRVCMCMYMSAHTCHNGACTYAVHCVSLQATLHRTSKLQTCMNTFVYSVVYSGLHLNTDEESFGLGKKFLASYGDWACGTLFECSWNSPFPTAHLPGGARYERRLFCRTSWNCL